VIDDVVDALACTRVAPKQDGAPLAPRHDASEAVDTGVVIIGHGVPGESLRADDGPDGDPAQAMEPTTIAPARHLTAAPTIDLMIIETSLGYAFRNLLSTLAKVNRIASVIRF